MAVWMYYRVDQPCIFGKSKAGTTAAKALLLQKKAGVNDNGQDIILVLYRKLALFYLIHRKWSHTM